jgi:hypothetical protein
VAVPTISSVTPSSGHTGGKTLVEIAGTNFATPAPPPATGVAPAPAPSVAVTFGGEPALEVAVLSATLIRCLTPIRDQRVVLTPFTVDASTNTFTSAAHGLIDGTIVFPVVTSAAGLPAPLVATRGYYVRDAAANTFKLSATLGGSAIDVTTAVAASLKSVGAYDVAVQNLDANGAPIPGEVATRAKAYTFRRPDLTEDSDLSRVVETLVLELRRQVVEEVAIATHSDYDLETADALNVVDVARLPALVLVGPQLTENRFYSRNDGEEIETPNDGFVRRAPPVTVDLIFQVFGLSDSTREILNLAAAVVTFFRKNIRIGMARSATDPLLGRVEWEVDFEPGAEPAVVTRGNNANLRSFTGSILVRGVDIEAFSGLPTASIADVPSSIPAEGTIAVGKTADEIVVEPSDQTAATSPLRGADPGS